MVIVAKIHQRSTPLHCQQDFGLRGVQFLNNGISGTTVRREKDLDGSGGSELLGEDGDSDRAE